MASPRNGTIVDERYRLERKVGSGGMADVWLAQDLELDRRVALKILHSRFAQDQEFVERFRREASSAGGLQHPNVVAVYDRGEFEDSYYIAMEYVEGDSLKDLIAQGMTVPAAVEVIRQVLEAARFAHKKGVVHRDMKPHNVLIDNEGRARVTDFGIARAGSSEITQTGSVMGTAQYLSPEQAQGKEVTEASDIYSIGVVLYEALTGRVPFEADSPVAVALKQVQEVPRRPSTINPDVSPALDAVTMRALAKEPERRFKDAKAFINALDEAEEQPNIPRKEDTAAYPVVGVGGEYEHPGYEEEEEFAPHRGRPWWQWLLIALLVSAVAALVALALTGQLSSKGQVVVPSVIDQSQSAASAVLSAEGLNVATTLVPNPKPRDTVLEQDPLPGDKVDKGSTVTLTVSSGPGTVQIPDVKGLSETAATRKLQGIGLSPQPQPAFSNDVPSGAVAGTDPAAGISVQTGTNVKLLISKGPNKATVPGVVGLSTQAAVNKIQAANLTANIQQQQNSAPQGKVLSQSPTAGQMLSPGGQVTIFVSTGTVQVPNVVGSTKDAAISVLKQAGLKAVVSGDTSAAPAQAGIVTNQFPSAGSTTSRGSTVQISVGQPPGSPPP